MTPEELIHSMCARHGLEPKHAARLLPLVEKALAAPYEVRERILALIEGSLAEHTREQREAGLVDERKKLLALERDVLVGVARVLHGWSPADAMLDLGAQGPRSNPELDGA
jgi:hypothetical protein